MLLPPAVVIHGIDDARAALAPGMPVTLLSARGAALYAGCAVWRSLVALARAEAPAVRAPDILDCADAAGYALSALRLGQHVLVLDLDIPGRAGVAAIAAGCGAVLLPAPPPALDLGRPGATRGLVAWLGGAAADDSQPRLR